MSDAVDTSKLYAQLDKISNISQVSPTRAGAEVILQHALEKVPVRTGFLRDSGQVTESDGNAAVEFTADYAADVEYGTSNMEAQPYLRPAVDEYEKEILDAVARSVQEEIKEAI
jgi:HK97 gp10 family phage protein